jgi:tetratricopeptide (TPR) repeat protein
MKMIFTKGLKSLKYFLIIILIMLSILSGLFRDVVYAQQKAQQQVLKGVQLFWSAKFDEAIEVLRQAITLNTLSQDELFSAYLYLGFSLVRLGGESELIDQTFRQAVNANPRLKLDSFKIPPDLLNRFEGIRKGMIGSVYITSNSPGAEVIGYNQEQEIKFQGETPYLFNDLLAETYDILILKKDYQEKILRVNLSPAVVDTFHITLRLKEKPFYKKWWSWAGGGIVIASIIAIVSTKESSKIQLIPSDLPMPPDRPR